MLQSKFYRLSRKYFLFFLVLNLLLCTGLNRALPANASPAPSFAVEEKGPSEVCGGVFYTTADATVSELHPAMVLGLTPTVGVSQSLSGQERTLLAFDGIRAGVPPGATIYSAELYLDIHKVAAVPYKLGILGVKNGWSESTVTWTSRPTELALYHEKESSLVSGTLVIDVTTLVTLWATGAISETSMSLLPLRPASDVQFIGKEADAPRSARLSVKCAKPIEVLPSVDSTVRDDAQFAAYEKLQKASQLPVTLQSLPGGVVNFADFAIPTPQEVHDNLDRAEWFLNEYADLLRIDKSNDAWQLIRRSDDNQHFFFRQLHAAIPVVPAEISVHIIGDKLTGVAGNYVPGITLSPIPSLESYQAEELARAHRGEGAMLTGDTQLRYLNLGLLGYYDDGTHLAWEVVVDGQSSFIDANSGALLVAFPREQDAFDVDIWNGNNMGPSGVDAMMRRICWDAIPGEVRWFDENGVISPDPSPLPDEEGNRAFENIRRTDAYYRSTFSRDSYNGGGRRIDMYVRVGTIASWGGGPNAQYNPNCETMEFSENMAALDTTAHEFTHGVIRHTSDIRYVNQSGALNESLADIFAHFVDNDDWTHGEDGAGGASRDLSNPIRGNPVQPDHMLPSLSTDGQGLLTLPAGVMPGPINDNGFVHFNSGIHNKAAFLLIAGGTFAGRTVTGIGQAKAQRLFYNMMVNRLTSNSQFQDAANAAFSEAFDLIRTGRAGFTTADLCSVRNAYAAVGLGTGDADCDGRPDAFETDSDGDTIPDSRDSCPFVRNFGGEDADRDGMGNACDPDDDNDMVNDFTPTGERLDNCQFVRNPDQLDWNRNGIGDACEDSDRDGVVDSSDNCLTVSNPDRRDTDNDGMGDRCDQDLDGDGHNNPDDNCPERYNPGQEDSDGDGIGDVCDLCPGLANPDNGDPDHDGIGNPCDPDDDNDGRLDGADNCPLVANPDQRDDDEDGIGFACDLDEQEAFRALVERTEAQINLMRLLDLPIIRVPIPGCYSCPDVYLPPGFERQIAVQMPIDFTARIVDAEGYTVAKSEPMAALDQSLAFSPVPYAVNEIPFAGMAAADGVSSTTHGAAYTRYYLEIYAPSAEVGKSYPIGLTINNEIHPANPDAEDQIFLPLLTH